jgi:hypothetical protein
VCGAFPLTACCLTPAPTASKYCGHSCTVCYKYCGHSCTVLQVMWSLMYCHKYCGHPCTVCYKYCSHSCTVCYKYCGHSCTVCYKYCGHSCTVCYKYCGHSCTVCYKYCGHSCTVCQLLKTVQLTCTALATTVREDHVEPIKDMGLLSDAQNTTALQPDAFLNAMHRLVATNDRRSPFCSTNCC